MNDQADLRASDQERERAAREIREHFAAGRLSEDELGDRLSAVYRAQTQDELRTLRADLPQLPATQAERRAELAERRGHLQRQLIQQSGGGVALLAVCSVIWLLSGAHGQFWPVWVAIVVLIPLLRNGWRLYGPSPEFDRVEQELARRERGSRTEHRSRRRSRRT